MTEEIVTTPAVERAIELLKESVATRAIGVICGANGSGKTFALKAMEGRYGKLELPGTCFRYRCCQVNGPMRGVRDLLTEIGCGRGSLLQNGSSATLQLLVKYALHEFRKRNIRTLLLDEADLWGRDSLGGLITLYDFCRENDFPITIIMTGVLHPDQWIKNVSAALSRTLRIETVGNFDAPVMLAVLQEWGEPFLAWTKLVRAGNAEANKTARAIHKATNGNLRRMRYFADLFLLQNADVSRKSVEAIFAKMMRIGASA